jgi:hypothetical protein
MDRRGQDILVNTYEKSAQEYFKESMEYGSLIVGCIFSIIAVLFGIYFSQIAISNVVGTIGVMLVFSWCLSIVISPLEIAAVKLLGNKERAKGIAYSNKGEYIIVLVLTVILFTFDIITNWIGLGSTAVQRASFQGQAVGVGGWAIIVLLGTIMAVSEVIAGWMFRAVAVSYVSYKRAKQKYNTYKRELDNNTRIGYAEEIDADNRRTVTKLGYQNYNKSAKKDEEPKDEFWDNIKKYEEQYR